MWSGLPGGPDTQFVNKTLNEYTQRHQKTLKFNNTVDSFKVLHSSLASLRHFDYYFNVDSPNSFPRAILLIKTKIMIIRTDNSYL